MKRTSESASGSRLAPRAGSLCVAMCGMLVAASALAIAGCGQRGPLYLPQRTGTVVKRRAPAAASPQVAPAADPAASPSQRSSSSSSSSSTVPGK